MRTSYPSDITREQYEEIRETLESAKKQRALERLIYTMFSAPYCTACARAAAGDLCHMISLHGNYATIIALSLEVDLEI